MRQHRASWLLLLTSFGHHPLRPRRSPKALIAHRQSLRPMFFVHARAGPLALRLRRGDRHHAVESSDVLDGNRYSLLRLMMTGTR